MLVIMAGILQLKIISESRTLRDMSFRFTEDQLSVGKDGLMSWKENLDISE